MGSTLYGYTLDEHEYKVTVPCMYRAPSSEPTVIVAVSAHGGGTVGNAYANNGWDYAVYVDGREVISGQDLRSGGMAKTHAEMACTMCGSLSADAESLEAGTRDSELSRYSADARAFLESEGERLSLLASE